MTSDGLADGDIMATTETNYYTDSRRKQHLIALLFREYEVLSHKLFENDQRFANLITSSIAAASIAAGFVVLNLDNVWVAVLAPLFIFSLYSVLTISVQQSMRTYWNLRLVSDEINYLNQDPVLLQYSRAFPDQRVLTWSYGGWRFRAFHVVYFLVAASLLIVFVANSWHSMRTLHFLGATLILVLYLVLMTVLFAGIYSAFFDLRVGFREYFRVVNERRKMGMVGLPRLPKPEPMKHSLYRVILVRPEDLLVKSTPFVIGWAFAFLWLRDSSTQIARWTGVLYPGTFDVDNASSRSWAMGSQEMWPITFSSHYWTSPDDAPMWAWITIAFVYWLISDLLINQSKLLLNDLRDHYGDGNESGLGVRGRITDPTKANRIHVLLRWSLGMVLAFVVGGGWFLLAVSLISVQQLGYEFFLKPKGKDGPVLVLVWMCFSPVVRFFPGLLAVTGAFPWKGLLDDNQAFLILTLVLLTGMFHQVNQISLLWKIEGEGYISKRLVKNMNSEKAEHYKDLLTDKLRGQSGFYWMHGGHLQNLGWFAAALVATVGLAYEIGLVSNLVRLVLGIWILLLVLWLIYRVRTCVPANFDDGFNSPRWSGLFMPFFLIAIVGFIFAIGWESRWMFLAALWMVPLAHALQDPRTTLYEWRMKGLMEYGRYIALVGYYWFFGAFQAKDSQKLAGKWDWFQILFRDPVRGKSVVFDKSTRSNEASETEIDLVLANNGIVASTSSVIAKNYTRLGPLMLLKESVLTQDGYPRWAWGVEFKEKPVLGHPLKFG